jgi:hypothetical protein
MSTIMQNGKMSNHKACLSKLSGLCKGLSLFRPCSTSPSASQPIPASGQAQIYLQTLPFIAHTLDEVFCSRFRLLETLKK